MKEKASGNQNQNIVRCLSISLHFYIIIMCVMVIINPFRKLMVSIGLIDMNLYEPLKYLLTQKGLCDKVLVSIQYHEIF